MNTFTASGALKFGWETFKKRVGFFLGVTVIFFIAEWVLGFLAGLGSNAVGAHTSGSIVSYAIQIVLGVFVNMGIVTFTLKAYDNVETVALADLWHPQPFVQYLTMTIFSTVATIIGFCLLIVPGIIVSIMLMFAGYIIIDRNLDAVAALKESRRITYGHKLDLFGFLLLIVLFNLVGLLALVVGLFVTIPVTMLAMVYAYRTISGGQSVSEAAPSPSEATV